MARFAYGFLLVVVFGLVAAGCGKSPRVDENKNAPTSQNEQTAVTNPHLQPTIKGDIERASLAISMARDSAKANKWAEAISHLKSARTEVEAALNRNPSTREDLEALRSAIDRTIPLIENRSENSEAKLTELQTRIGVIKVRTF